jgi:hypothetical protein
MAVESLAQQNAAAKLKRYHQRVPKNPYKIGGWLKL